MITLLLLILIFLIFLHFFYFLNKFKFGNMYYIFNLIHFILYCLNSSSIHIIISTIYASCQPPLSWPPPIMLLHTTTASSISMVAAYSGLPLWPFPLPWFYHRRIIYSSVINIDRDKTKEKRNKCYRMIYFYYICYFLNIIKILVI